MQIVQEPRSVSSGGIASTAKMGINMDGTAFKILSDGLYKEKIPSIVRETACNAYDSHVAAGKADVPIKIKLPNLMDPTYTVTDYGIGLDEKGVMEVATTYFSSTKRDENTSIGGFGLGFKSPFAYTDQWNIIATHSGKRRTFSAFMSEDGTPTVVLFSTEETDECNGVTISVPVVASDFHKFRAAVEDQLQYFSPRPDVSGDTVAWPECEKYFEEEGVFFLPEGRNQFQYGRRITAVVGNVGYRVDLSALEDNGLGLPLSRLAAKVNLTIYFSIGSVIPTPSREELQYNKRTCDTIIEKIVSVFDKIPKIINSQIDESKSLYEAKEVVFKASKALTTNTVKTYSLNNYNGVNLLEPVVLSYPSSQLAFVRLDDITRAGQLRMRTQSRLEILHPSKVSYLFYDDLDSKRSRQSSRVAKYMTENRTTFSDHCLYVSGVPLDKLKESLGGFPEDKIVMLSTVEPPATAIRSTGSSGCKSSYSGPPLYKYTLRGGYVCPTENVDSFLYKSLVQPKELPSKGIYVLTERRWLKKAESKIILSGSFKGTEVYFVPSSKRSFFENSDKWITLFDFAKEKFEKEFSYKDYKNALYQNRLNTALCEDLDHYLSHWMATLNTQKFPVKAFWKIQKILSKGKNSVDSSLLVSVFAQDKDQDLASHRLEAKKKAKQLIEEYHNQHPKFHSIASRIYNCPKSVRDEIFALALKQYI